MVEYSLGAGVKIIIPQPTFLNNSLKFYVCIHMHMFFGNIIVCTDELLQNMIVCLQLLFFYKKVNNSKWAKFKDKVYYMN